MNGVLSNTPNRSSVRILIGTHLLFGVEAGLVLFTGGTPDLMLRSICGLTLLLGAAALIAAIHGGPADDGSSWAARRYGRRAAGGRP